MSDPRKEATKTQTTLGVARGVYPFGKRCTNLMTTTTACESGRAGEQSIVAAAPGRTGEQVIVVAASDAAIVQLAASCRPYSGRMMDKLANGKTQRKSRS